MKQIIILILVLGAGGSLGSPTESEKDNLSQIIEPGKLKTFMQMINAAVGSTYALFKGVDYKYDNVYNTQLMYQILNTYMNSKQRKLEEEQRDVLTNDFQEDQIHFLIITTLFGFTITILIIMLATQLRKIVVRAKKRNNKLIKRKKAEEEIEV